MHMYDFLQAYPTDGNMLSSFNNYASHLRIITVMVV